MTIALMAYGRPAENDSIPLGNTVGMATTIEANATQVFDIDGDRARLRRRSIACGLTIYIDE